jgi:hypothetical protein
MPLSLLESSNLHAQLRLEKCSFAKSHDHHPSPNTCSTKAEDLHAIRQLFTLSVSGRRLLCSCSRCQRTCLLARIGRPAKRTADTAHHAICVSLLRCLVSWWSRTGSNRRPPACKAGALPTELRPRAQQQMVGLGRLELPTSRLSGVRSNHLSYRPRSGRSPKTCGSQRDQGRVSVPKPSSRPCWEAINDNGREGMCGRRHE